MIVFNICGEIKFEAARNFFFKQPAVINIIIFNFFYWIILVIKHTAQLQNFKSIFEFIKVELKLLFMNISKHTSNEQSLFEIKRAIKKD
jgi:hypothetical protein